MREMATATVEAAAAGGVAHTMRSSPSSRAPVWLVPKRQSWSGRVRVREPGLGLGLGSGLKLG